MLVSRHYLHFDPLDFHDCPVQNIFLISSVISFWPMNCLEMCCLISQSLGFFGYVSIIAISDLALWWQNVSQWFRSPWKCAEVLRLVARHMLYLGERSMLIWSKCPFWKRRVSVLWISSTARWLVRFKYCLYWFSAKSSMNLKDVCEHLLLIFPLIMIFFV